MARAQVVDTPHHEEQMLEVLKRYASEGFDGQFAARPDGMVQCLQCRDVTAAEQVPLAALHRFEGVSDPNEEAVVTALECPACGALGTMILPYGPYATQEEDEVLRLLMDERSTFSIRTGC